MPSSPWGGPARWRSGAQCRENPIKCRETASLDNSSLEAEEIKEALAGHVDAALLAPTSPRKVPEWLLALKDALTAKCCVGDASGERGAAQ